MVYIVVEGKDDENFLRQLIAERIHNQRHNFIKIENNAGNLTSEDIDTIDTETDSLKKKTIFVVDADSEKERYLSCISGAFDKFNQSDAFFFPDGNNPGNLETLLRTIVADNYSSLLEDCIDNYAECVNTLNVGDYQVNEKTKLWIYTSALTKDSRGASGAQRRYVQPYFDLNSPSLNPLVQFLQNHFTL